MYVAAAAIAWVPGGISLTRSQTITLPSVSTQSPINPPGHASAANAKASDFLKKLATETALGEVRLPSFPDFATRVQKVLEDPRAAPAQIAQVIAADAALAARILRLANSAFMNPGGKQITDLKRAVTQLGHQLVRCTAVAFALQQMKFGGNAQLRNALKDLWVNGMLVASIAYVLARTTRAANPDEALVTGLMHNIGRLYIAVNLRPEGPGEGSEWTAVVNEWHPKIAYAILKHWKFAATISEAVREQNSWGRETQGSELTDILIASTALVPCVFYREQLKDTITAVPPFKRLKLDAARCRQLMADSAQQIRALQTSLSA